ncbi:molybdopterin molybdotransferase MoeA [Corynebacterium sp. Sa1YVA5]|uniref:Molybdopterin molybdenumtransferase n=2 Tax=Corynebacterium gallinarum TaxID=2762214 RepID=A0A8I0HND3_9CORY|nr:molybdopterin molybdotransferase MoeA [Corynebacterium gallinarum]
MMRVSCSLTVPCPPSVGDAFMPTASITEHLTRVLSLCTPAAPVTLPVPEATGCVLAADAHAILPVPPFSNSAMDGFLVHASDLAEGSVITLPVVGDVPAGGGAITPAPGTAVRIMTGAAIADPHGLVVIPVEDTSADPGPQDLPETVTISSYRGRAHIRPRGDNVNTGDVLAGAGDTVDAGLLAGLISAGVREVSVFPAPAVTVLSSGDELVDARYTPTTGQIPDSNRPMVAQLLRELGITHVTELHTGDDPADFTAALREAVDHSHLIITTGGVAAGAFDVVKTVMSAGDMWFGHVDMQPGKTQGAGSWAGVPVLCLPGNPVAAYVSFLMFVTPAIARLRGRDTPADLDSRPRVTATACAPFPSARAKNLIVPVRLTWDANGAGASPFTRAGRGSHFAASLNGVGGFVLIPPGGTGPQAGGKVTVYLT